MKAQELYTISQAFLITRTETAMALAQEHFRTFIHEAKKCAERGELSIKFPLVLSSQHLTMGDDFIKEFQNAFITQITDNGFTFSTTFNGDKSRLTSLVISWDITKTFQRNNR